MASQYLHILKGEKRCKFGATIQEIADTSGFQSDGSWAIHRIIHQQLTVQSVHNVEQELEDFLNFYEEQVKETAAQLCDDYQDYNCIDEICLKKKKTLKKLPYVVISDDDVDVLPVVLPLHSIVIQDYTKPSNSIGYKVPPKEPTSEERKKTFKGLKQNRKCSRNKQRDFKELEASQIYLLD